MNNPVNLASLPKEEALLRARAAGRAIFADEQAVAPIYQDLMCRWANENMPHAVGQTDQEFGELLSDVEKQFEVGLDEAVKQARSDVRSAAALERASVMLDDESAAAWQVFNVLAFMVEAVPDDKIGELPLRCTLVNLREQVEKIATNLMNLCEAEREAGGLDHVE